MSADSAGKVDVNVSAEVPDDVKAAADARAAATAASFAAAATASKKRRSRRSRSGGTSSGDRSVEPKKLREDDSPTDYSDYELLYPGAAFTVLITCTVESLLPRTRTNH